MKSKPFIIAGGVGAALGILWVIIGAAYTVFFVLPQIDVNIAPDPGSMMGGATAILGFVGLCLSPIVNAGIGVLYVYLHRREAQVMPEIGAMGGAASAALGRLVAGVVSVFLSFITTNMMMQQIAGVENMFNDPAVAGIMAISTTVGGLFGICISGMIGALFGAIGGGLGAWWFNRESNNRDDSVMI
jgi:hypothetical protein